MSDHEKTSEEVTSAERGVEARWHATRRGRLGWYCYDWANSVYTTSVTSIFFGPFITDVCERAADSDGYLRPLGIPILAGSFFPYLTGLSVFLQIFVLPTAAALTERHDKGTLLGALACCGSGAAISMYTIGDTDYVLGGALYIVATMALGASITVADTYLPVLAPAERQDRASTQASAAGFLSSGSILLINLLLFTHHENLGLTEDQAVRIILLTAGTWWLIFSITSVRLLRGYGSPPAVGASADDHPERIGAYRALISGVWRMRKFPAAAWLLAAFFFYNNGMQVVTSLVSTFALEELKLDEDAVIVTVLAVQFVAIAGSLAAGRLAERHGGRNVLLRFVLIWSSVVVAGSLIPDRSLGAFVLVALGAGFVLGGTYALSRSVFIRLLPPEQAAEYFGIFETVNRCLGFVGTTTFGLILQWSGSYRAAWLSALGFFLAGGLTLVVSTRRPGHKDREFQQEEEPRHG
jgi:UMF1 family MFS transporter